MSGEQQEDDISVFQSSFLAILHQSAPEKDEDAHLAEEEEEQGEEKLREPSVLSHIASVDADASKLETLGVNTEESQVL